jgi:hypothetical protein
MGIRTDRLLGFSGPREYLQALARAQEEQEESQSQR